MAAAPNLKDLTVNLADALRRTRGCVTQSEVDSLKACPDQALMLLTLRIIARVLIRTGALTDEEVSSAAAAATPKMTPLSAMTAPASTPVTRKIGEYNPYELVKQVDVMLSSPLRNSCLPAWFTDDFWPGCLRRLACGEKLSEREAGIARTVLTGDK